MQEIIEDLRSYYAKIEECVEEKIMSDPLAGKEVI